MLTDESEVANVATRGVYWRIQFEWDRDGSAGNIAKHGGELCGPLPAVWTGRSSPRFMTGANMARSEGTASAKVDGILYLVVIHTDRDERIRIISARPATRSERQRYDETL